jgi:hypothetical protein
MMPTHLLAFAVTSFVLIVIPGPSMLFTIGRPLTIGRCGALMTVVGNAAGACLQVVAVAFGLGALVKRSILAFTAPLIVRLRLTHLPSIAAHPAAGRVRTARAAAPSCPPEAPLGDRCGTCRRESRDFTDAGL